MQLFPRALTLFNYIPAMDKERWVVMGLYFSDHPQQFNDGLCCDWSTMIRPVTKMKLNYSLTALKNSLLQYHIFFFLSKWCKCKY